jgi:hypothetical protein
MWILPVFDRGGRKPWAARHGFSECDHLTNVAARWRATFASARQEWRDGGTGAARLIGDNIHHASDCWALPLRIDFETIAPAFIMQGQVAKIVAAYLRKNAVSLSDIPGVITQVYQSLAALGRSPIEPSGSATPKPAVPIRRSDSARSLLRGYQTRLLIRVKSA